MIKRKRSSDNIKDINQGYPLAINRRHHNTISEKLEAIEYLKKGNCIHKTAEKYTVERKTIKYQIEHEKNYLNNITGRRGKYMSLDRRTKFYVLSLENSSLKGRKELTNIKLISRLLKRRGYSKSTVGHRGQEISTNSMKDCDTFLFEIIELRKKYKFEPKNILNWDETDFCLNKKWELLFY